MISSVERPSVRDSFRPRRRSRRSPTASYALPDRSEVPPTSASYSLNSTSVLGSRLAFS